MKRLLEFLMMLLAMQIAPAFAQDASGDALIAKGEYLSKIGGCAGCHTAPNGGKPFAGGRGVNSPFGTIFSTNITPDPIRGIGSYSFEDFSRAVRHGDARGKHLYPAMPYASYVKLKDEDVRALYEYLQHRVAPVNYVPPPNEVVFPFNQRWALKIWRLMFMPSDKVRITSDAQWSRGAYLAQSIGHCGACHTPRGSAFQEQGYDEASKKFLTGEENDHWFASNLTGDRGSGLGRWNADDIASFLKTGHGAGTIAFGSMAEEVEQSLQHISEGDAKAIAVYLKTLPAREGNGVYQENSETVRKREEGNYTGNVESLGAATYRGFCQQCHQADGRGIAMVFPRLAGNPAMLSDDATSLIRIVVQGGKGPKTEAALEPAQMPAFAGTLTDVQIAQVLTYTREAWGNYAKPVNTSEVTKLRKSIKN